MKRLTIRYKEHEYVTEDKEQIAVYESFPLKDIKDHPIPCGPVKCLKCPFNHRVNKKTTMCYGGATHTLEEIPDEPFIFQAGDIVKWCGVEGEVYFEDDTYVHCRFNDDEIGYNFYKDGKGCKWHKDVSLELIRRPKKKLKFKDLKNGKEYKHNEILYKMIDDKLWCSLSHVNLTAISTWEFEEVEQ